VVHDHHTAQQGPGVADRRRELHESTVVEARRPFREASLSYSVVVPTKDRQAEVEETVELLLDQSRLPERIVVADASACSYEPRVELADRAHRLGVELVVLESRPSVHAQRNAGVGRVETAIVLFLDDDVRIPPDYAEALLARWELRGLRALGGIQGTPAVVPCQSRLERALRRVTMLSFVDPQGESMTLRRSGKVRFVPEPRGDVQVPVLASGATAYRTELARAHPFDERFPGYTPGGDLEMAARVAQEAALLQTPEVRWTHLWHPRERISSTRWYVRGRCETYFRLRRLDRSPLTLGAFAISLLADGTLALADSIRQREPGHVHGFARGVLQTLREKPPPAGR
jgi:glycosyltransferase involved in cell wall biosynthesis